MRGVPEVPCNLTTDGELQAAKSLKNGPELAAGFTEAQILGFGKFLSRPLTHGDIAVLGKIWKKVAHPEDIAQLTKSSSRRLFNNHRKRFWKSVANDPDALEIFKKAGCIFDKPGNAPYYVRPTGQRIRMTIDHIAERQSSWLQALNPANLRIVFEHEKYYIVTIDK